MTYNEFINLLENKNIETGEIDYKKFIETINKLDINKYLEYFNKYLDSLEGNSKLPLSFLNSAPCYIELKNDDRTMILFRMLQNMNNDDIIKLLKLALYSFRLKELYTWDKDIKCDNCWELKNLSENFYNMVTSKNLPQVLKSDRIYDYNYEPVLMWSKNLYAVASMSQMIGFKSLKTVESMYNAFKKGNNEMGKRFANDLLSFLVKQDKKKYSAKVMEIKLS